MSDNTENLVLEHLRHIRRKVDGLADDMQDVKFRIGQVERALVGVHDTLAHHSLRFDRLEQRIERIDTRLGLIEA